MTVARLRHGKVNALDLEVVRDVTAAVRDVKPGRALVITGAGSVFSAGVDLRRLGDGGSEYAREFVPALSGMSLAIFDHPDGPALGALVLTAAPLDAVAARSVGLIHAVEAPEALLDS